MVYSFKASGDYAPTFVSENIKRLLGYCPEKYLEHADFWRSHVHPDDLPAVEAEQAKLFEKGRHTAEYRFRKKNGVYILGKRRAIFAAGRRRGACRDRGIVEQHHCAQGR